MDESAFDDLAKGLTIPSRRGIVAAGAGALAAIVALLGRDGSDVALAKKKKGGKKQKGGQGPPGPPGAQGPQGLQGPAGPVRMAYAAVNVLGVFDPARSSGVNGITVTGTSNNVYCFDLAFTPNVAVGSPYITNGGMVATWTPGENLVGASCPEGFQDAAVKTYGSDGLDAAFGFKIVFF